jgi:mannose-1-phosphate guanylyltransferase
MAGGSGTRFWPASRRDRPKQFLPIGSAESLLAQTARRLEGVVAAERVLVVCAADQVERVRETLPDLPASNILAEPVARNTAPCIAFAAAEIAAREAHSLQVVLPADHVIRPVESFRESLRAALSEAEQSGALIGFGIRPGFPATGFGYLELEDKAASGGGALRVRRFVEKPDLERARAFLAGGRHLWNSGIFVWRTDAIRSALRECLPEIAAALEGPPRGEALAAAYANLPSISIDYGVLEHAADVRALRVDYPWSDVGAWDALSDVADADDRGHVVVGGGELEARDAQNCIVYGESGQLTCLIGVSDLVVVRSGDAVLVCPKARAQEVKDLVEQLKQNGRGSRL